MLSLAAVKTIERRFAAGDDVPAIAAAVGCAPSTVRTVLAGRHSSQLRPPAAAEWAELSPFQPLAAPVRCRGCGGLVSEVPCVLCACLASRPVA